LVTLIAKSIVEWKSEAELPEIEKLPAEYIPGDAS
jgi:hypothetical protein